MVIRVWGGGYECLLWWGKNTHGFPFKIHITAASTSHTHTLTYTAATDESYSRCVSSSSEPTLFNLSFKWHLVWFGFWSQTEASLARIFFIFPILNTRFHFMDVLNSFSLKHMHYSFPAVMWSAQGSALIAADKGCHSWLHITRCMHRRAMLSTVFHLQLEKPNQRGYTLWIQTSYCNPL